MKTGRIVLPADYASVRMRWRTIGEPVCPPGSDAAVAAIERVRLALLGEKGRRVGLTITAKSSPWEVRRGDPSHNE